jgi:hypothetical protein
MAAVMVVPLVVQMASMACYSVVSKAAAMVVQGAELFDPEQFG